MTLGPAELFRYQQTLQRFTAFTLNQQVKRETGCLVYEEAFSEVSPGHSASHKVTALWSEDIMNSITSMW